MDKKGFRITGLVLGIVGLCMSLSVVLWFLALPASIVGLVLSILANKSKKSGMGTAGFVLSLIALILSGLVVVACALGLGAIASVMPGLI